ncbi:hypothetical protein [Caulobacter mirabilis]|uniref:Bulb-type lectin domain-containing protein n=1 Tax=Caulobacter mirabilis TaxID=69666 RepID=A0A2D2AZ21_9CAUL|nr:hypothetical protein [Caulobacter mirabilis]ATQ43215.1 hypothetical protein CSW64_12710 [Caulobacter mirabilis]
MRKRNDDDGPIGNDPIEPNDPPPPSPPPPPPPPPPPETVAQGTTAWAHQYLPADHALHSPNGRFALVYQGDGNLVLYKNYPYNNDRKALWSIGKQTAPGRALMQGDGNLVVSDAFGGLVWASRTERNPGACLAVHDNGNVVVYSPARNATIWSTNTSPQALPPNGPTATGSIMRPGQVLHPGDELWSDDNRFILRLEHQGNLVLYRNLSGVGRRSLWDSDTHGRLVEVCILYDDGNLVLAGPNDELVWNSGSHAPGGYLEVGSDGNLVIWNAQGQAAWHTDTPRCDFRRDFGDKGEVSVSIWPDGRVRFKGTMRNTGLRESVDFRVGALVTFPGEVAGKQVSRTIALYRNGHLGTEAWPGGSPVTRFWDVTEANGLVEREYLNIEAAGQFKVMHEREGKISDLLEAALDKVIKWVAGEILLASPMGHVILMASALASAVKTGSILPGVRFVEGAFWLVGPGGSLYALGAHGLSGLGDDGLKPMPEWMHAFGQAVFKGTLPHRRDLRITKHQGLNGNPFVFPSIDGTILHLGPDIHAAKCLGELSSADKISLVHELVHVWQIEHTDLSVDWIADALYWQTCDSLGGDAYSFDPNNLKSFGDYNLEQQAEIVEAWYEEAYLDPCKPLPDPPPPGAVENHTGGGKCWYPCASECPNTCKSLAGRPEQDASKYYHYMTNHIWMGRVS